MTRYRVEFFAEEELFETKLQDQIDIIKKKTSEPNLQLAIFKNKVEKNMYILIISNTGFSNDIKGHCMIRRQFSI
jgi:hypothetical protein